MYILIQKHTNKKLMSHFTILLPSQIHPPPSQFTQASAFRTYILWRGWQLLQTYSTVSHVISEGMMWGIWGAFQEIITKKNAKFPMK